MGKIKSFIPLIALLILMIAAILSATQADKSQQAQALMNDGKYEQAKSLCQQILAENPNSDEALEAQKQIVIIYIAINDQNKADVAFEQLSEKYSEHKDFSDAVRVIGDNYLWRSKDEKARDMYNIAVADTKSTNAILAKMGLAIASINLSDLETGDSLTKQILSDFTDDDRLSMASRQIADAYRYTNHHEQAIELYQYVLGNHADSEHAMWSQMGFAISNICLGNYDAAESATQKLSENYSEHPSIYKAVQAIADHYRWRDVQLERARQLYAVACEGISGPDSIWAKMGFVITSIHFSDFETSDLWTDKILNEFAGNENLPKVIWRIADVYHYAGKYDEASALGKYLLDNFPDHKQLLQVKTLMVKIDIARENEEAAEKAIDNLYIEFKDNPELAETIFNIGDKYWDMAINEVEKDNSSSDPNNEIPGNLSGILSEKSKDYFEKALAVWKKEYEQLPLSRYTKDAWYFSGVIYRRHLRDTAKGLTYYQKVVDEWPDYRYAWSAQAMIGHCYGQLLDAGLMSEAEAEPKIEQAYKTLIERYPDCSLTQGAYIKVGQINYKNAQWEQAAYHFQQYLNKYPQAGDLGDVLVQLGVTYEKWDKPDVAAALYDACLETTELDEYDLEMLKARIKGLEGEEK